MKLDYQYEAIKQKILRGLESQGITKTKLATYFKEIQCNKVNGDFNRACTWVGFQFNGFWREDLKNLYGTGVNDDHIKTLYRKFFKDLKFHEIAA